MDPVSPPREPHDLPPTYRREVDRETIRLLRAMQEDNARLIELFRLALAALVRIEQHVGGQVGTADDWPALG